MTTETSRAERDSAFTAMYDVVICGAGHIGFAAAREAGRNGLRCLLVEATGDLLWESTRALCNEAGTPADDVWHQWIGQLAAWPNGLRGGYFDSTLAEAVAAGEAKATGAQFQTLFYAMPVGVEKKGDAITAATLATKAGLRKVRGLRWVDATEAGWLARLAGVPSRLQGSSQTRRSAMLQSLDWEKLEEALNKFLARPESRALDVKIHPSAREEERRLSWKSHESQWTREAEALLGGLRRLAGKTPLLISHLAARGLPIYEGLRKSEEASPLPRNLVVLSPARATRPSSKPGERFLLGAGAVAALRECPEADSCGPAGISYEAKPIAESESCDIVVAGTGTAGAIAALAAAREGATVLAVDLAESPGGVGTSGGVCAYFHGAAGGLHREIDRTTIEKQTLFTGAAGETHLWHHEAKKFALLEHFAEAGVTFWGHSILCGIENEEGTTPSALLVAREGKLIRVAAKAFVDSSGDGDLCALAGADFVQGRAEDGRTLAFSQVAFIIRHTSEGLRVEGSNFDAGWVDPSDPEALSAARLTGVSDYLRADWSGTERPCSLAGLVSLRQSRHMVTDRMIGLPDLVDDTRFGDSIGRTDTVLDTHSVDFEFESDETMFYYWVCRAFRAPLACDLPYRMLLPVGLRNVWIACRSAGIMPEAAYGLRMQRDMQRLGEAAGVAAALSAKLGRPSREVPFAEIRKRLENTGAWAPPGPPEAFHLQSDLAKLRAGTPGLHLWRLHRHRDRAEEDIREIMAEGVPNASFLAASILAMSGDATAEPRLLEAIAAREEGPRGNHETRGAWGQEIDVPFWFLGIVLLRLCGTAASLDTLSELAGMSPKPFNLRTALALTVERYVARGVTADETWVNGILAPLQEGAAEEAMLPTTRSLWRQLRGETQLRLGNAKTSERRENHLWQLEAVTARIRQLLAESAFAVPFVPPCQISA